MNRYDLLAKPVWAQFLYTEGLHDLPWAALLAADQLFETIQRTENIHPGPSDYAMWAQLLSDGDPEAWLDQLGTALALLMPPDTEKVRAARTLLPNPIADEKSPTRERRPEPAWDPCDRPIAPGVRKFSIPPWELPDSWQTALRRAAQGLPGKKAAAPARTILLRMREKLCQCAWSARKAGLRVELTENVTRQCLEDLETRLRARPQGIRWATMRATAEELHRFAKYIGTVPEGDIMYLRKRRSRYEFFERGQDALKFAALLETGNTTFKVLDRADALLECASREEDHPTRHRLRNAGAILGLFSLVPLRNADAELVFGDTLFWESGTWVIDTEIRKTRHRSPDHLIVPLEPAFARYVDAVVLGDHDPRYLPEMRDRVVRNNRPLFVHPDGSRPSRRYIARVFKEHTGNAFTTTRTMLHTDQAISRGEVGTRDTMVLAHQTSPHTAGKYQAKRVRKVAVKRVQDAASARRAEILPPDLLDAVRELRQSEETVE